MNPDNVGTIVKLCILETMRWFKGFFSYLGSSIKYLYLKQYIMQRGFLIIFAFLQIQLLFAQSQQPESPDTLYVGDTIVRTRTVEKVVYVYGTPEYYLGFGGKAGYNYTLFSRVSSIQQSGYSYGADASFELLKDDWLFNLGLSYTRHMRSIDKVLQSQYRIQETHTQIDTLDWFEVNISDGVIERRYITETLIYDTLVSYYRDSAVQYHNTYNHIGIPIYIGYQLKYGFLSIDAKAGIIPGMYFPVNDQNIAISRDESVVQERDYMRNFTCDFGAALSFRYLLTFTTLLTCDVNYITSPFSMYKMDDVFALRKNSVGFRIGVSFILKEFD